MTVVLYIVVIGLILFVWISGVRQREDVASVANNTNHALCVLRMDLEQRVQDSIQFLTDHPDGIPGIPVESIQQSIDNQQRTINALADLSCAS